MRTRRGSLGVWLALVAAFTFCVGPLGWQLLTSLRPEGELTRLGWPSRLVFDSYTGVFATQPFGRVILNSFLVASLTTLICLTLGATASFALAKLRFRGQQWVLTFALATSMFPPIATVSPLFLVVRALGLRDEWAGLVLPYTSLSLPLTLWVLTSFFKELPDDLYRAARMDGCTPFQAFRYVLLPLSAPGLATTGLLVFIFSWNEFLYALTFTSSPQKRTIPVAISLFATEHKEPWGEIAAATLIVTVPLIVLTLLFQRRIISGLTAGAIKG